MKLIKAVSGDGHPMHVYKGSERYAGWHTETKTGDSVSFADTYNDTAEVELTGNQNGLQDVSGNLLSNGAVVGVLPPLRKVGAVSDSHVMRTGVKTKRISDWAELMSRPWTSNQFYRNSKRFVLQFLDATLGLSSFLCYKFNSTPLVGGTTSSEIPDLAQIAGSNYLYVNVSNEDSGMGFYSNPTASEIRAYFYGWKMCNADGSSPYYKSEVPYTPATWAEWSKDAGITTDSTGMTFIANKVASIPTLLKASTKYGLLLNISSYTSGSLSTTGGYVVGSSAGMKKLIRTIGASPETVFYLSAGSLGSMKATNVQVFELPTGSQIESDFSTMTADQLALKYTFNGLCIKNWKHVTDGLGQTAILPTATYAGYTPYKMLYELAVPVEEQYDPVDVPTHLGQTIIATDSIVKPTIIATAKVPD